MSGGHARMHNALMQYILAMGHVGHITRHGYVNLGPEHMPVGLADRLAHDRSLAQRGEVTERSEEARADFAHIAPLDDVEWTSRRFAAEFDARIAAAKPRSTGSEAA